MTQSETNRLLDRRDRYGWVSIALHWSAAAAVIALWFIGQGIEFAEPDQVGSRRRLHMSVGVTVWLLLALRLGWRLRFGHPRVGGVGRRTFRFARAVHYSVLAAIALMLVSGPVMAWANGGSIPVFSAFAIPAPFGESAPLRAAAHVVHVAAAQVVLWLTLLHVAGALVHLMFRDDDSFVRMLSPGRRRDGDQSGT